jgi:hypothetical protein
MKQPDKIILKVKGMSRNERTARLCELAMMEEIMGQEFGFVNPEDVFEYGLIQGIRIANGEIDKVLESLKNAEKDETGKIEKT